MRKEMTNGERRRALAFILCLLTGLWLTNCDQFETEVASGDEGLTTIQKEIVITPKNSGIFNLQSLIAGTGNRRLAITSSPLLGTLESLGNDVLRYTPHTGIVNGRDRLLISVFSPSNVVEKQDSIVIVITSDSTKVPCDLSVRAQNDLVYNVGTAGVEITVLDNDSVCGVPRSQLVVTVPEDLVIAGVPMPKSYFGNVVVLPDGRIRYTPGKDFKGGDKFVYRVEKPANVPKPGDFETVGYAFVYITSADSSCKSRLTLTDDAFRFKLDSINRTDSLFLNTGANDVICTQAVNNFVFTIKKFPAGKLYYGPDYGFKYLIPSNAQRGFFDEFSYQVCVDDVCKEAQVKIKLE